MPAPEPSAPRRPSRWRWIFSLRALMGLVLIVGGLLGWVIQRERVRRDAVALIHASQGYVAFRDEQPGAAGWRTWLYRRTGLEFCREVAMVTLNDGPPPMPPPGGGPFALDTPALPPAGRSSPPSLRVELFAAVARLGVVGACNVTGGSTAPAELAALAEGSIGDLSLMQTGEVSAEAVGALARMGSLRSFQIITPEVELSGAAVRAIGDLRSLAKVDLAVLAPITSADLAPLGRLRDLEDLNLSASPGDDAFLDALSDCRRLRALHLGGTQVTDARLRRLAAGAPGLADIWCDGSLLADAGVEALGSLARLKSCNLFAEPAGPARLSDASLVALGRCRSLANLGLPPGRFTDAGLAALGGLPLESLRLGGSVESLTESTLARLVAGRTFNILILPGPGIVDALVPILAGHLNPNAILSLDRSRITDAAARDLVTVGASSLSLSHTDLGDAGLAVLAAGPTLRGLNVEATRVTPAGAAAFRLARPDVLLSDEDPASARP